MKNQRKLFYLVLLFLSTQFIQPELGWANFCKKPNSEKPAQKNFSSVLSEIKTWEPDNSKWNIFALNELESKPGTRSQKEKIYLGNLRIALTEVFLPWFENSSTSNNFQEMLRKMHRSLAMGSDQSPSFYATGEYQTNQIFAGETRNDVSKKNQEDFEQEPVKFDWIYAVKERSYFFNPSLKQFNTALERVIAEFTSFSPHQLYIRAINSKEAFIEVDGEKYFFKVDVETVDGRPDRLAWTSNLENFPEQSSQLNSVFLEDGKLNQYALHEVPNAHQINDYLARGEVIMKELQGMKASPVDQTQFLQLLADYYQVMINAHPFIRINQSLLMAQVNSLLASFGFSPMKHNDMDIFAMGLSSSEFRRLFRNRVLR